MKTGLLLSVARVVVIGSVVGGTAEGWAACTTTPNCESLGYQYCASECPNGSVACPFDSNKHFCFSPNPYTVTAETCAAECKNVGTKSCTKNGTTYYESCGASTCSSGQTCENGTCKAVPKEGYCCGYSGCGYSGTSHSSDRWCQQAYGESCYSRCMKYYPACNDIQASCRAAGGASYGQYCSDIASNNYFEAFNAYFVCEMPKNIPTQGWCCGYGGCSTNEGWCQSIYGKDCYSACKIEWPDCGHMQQSCRASGGTPRFQHCGSSANSEAYYTCE